jgi:F0F1-type ATP synthase alpha subunit
MYLYFHFFLTRTFIAILSVGGDLVGRQVVFSSGLVGVVVTHRPPIVFVYCDMDQLDETDKGSVQILDSLAVLSISENAKCSDCFGRSLLEEEKEQDTTATTTTMTRAIYAPIPQIKDIALINSPFVTGITMFDALAPIGKGQNMLMIGHDIEDMRGYVCDSLAVRKRLGASEAEAKIKCIYASTSSGSEVTKMLMDAGVLDDVTLVTTQGSKMNMDVASQAAEATTIAATACAIGESYALEQGMDTFVIVDNIDLHKKLWDATTRVLVDVFGVDAVVKGDLDGGASSEMRAFYSSLIQRAAHFKEKRGGGSVTLLLLTTIPRLASADDDENAVFSPEEFGQGSAKVKDRIDLLVKKNIPLTAANLRKLSIPIPSDTEGKRRLVLQHIDDLISMSDGQIWLDEGLQQAGRMPAMDPQRSITRIGVGADTMSQADAPAMRRVAQGLRLNLAQALDMDGANVATTASIKQRRKSNSLLLAMHQKAGAGGRRLSESCALLLAEANGHLDGAVDEGIVAGSEQGEKLMRDLLEHLNAFAAGAMADIDTSQDMSESSGEEIEDAIKSFFS